MDDGEIYFSRDRKEKASLKWEELWVSRGVGLKYKALRKCSAREVTLDWE